MAKLNAKQAAFVREYLLDLNATQAAIRAGYSSKTARQMGSENLTKPDIQAEIKRRIERREKRTQIKADDVLQELAAIAYSDLRDYIEWTSRGVTLKGSKDLAPDFSSVIAEISETPTRYGKSLKFKLHDKLRALEMLAKHLGLFDITDRSDKTLMQAMFEAMTKDVSEYNGGERPE